MKSQVAVVVAIVVGCALLCLQAQAVNGQEVKVAAWNIKNLGMTRLDRDWITDVIVKVLCQYDLVFVQEILTHENTNRPVLVLQEALNTFAANYPQQCGHRQYKMHAGGPLGSTSHREFYVLFYSAQAFQFQHAAVFKDVYGVFERPPIVADMQLRSTGDRFILIGIHTKPRNVQAELNALSDVFRHAVGAYHIQSGFFIGDFNADYLSQLRIRSLTIASDPNRYHWLLNNVYTNVPRRPTSQRKLYDQIVAVGDRAMQCYVRGSAGVYEFDYLVPPGHTAWEVSDHYPIQMNLLCPRLG